ncbi:MAG: DUF4157 domain-containing protein [Desulfobacterales bacterium]
MATPAGVREVLRSSGHPLDPAIRDVMEPPFGHDLSRVRVHTDAAAGQSALEMNAHAYTVGNDVVFAPGRFAPDSDKGRRLLAHELTHVVQQGGVAAAVQRQPDAPDPDAERAAAVAEAEAVASVTSEELEAQVDAEEALKLNFRRRKDKRYAWSLGLKDRTRLKKAGELPPKLQQEIAVKLNFFTGEAKAAYLRTISPALAEFPSDQVIAVLSARPGAGAGVEQKTPGLACDAAQKEFVLRYEGEPEKTRCMDITTDPEFANAYFDANIKSAAGYAVDGTTWENVEYDRFRVMLVTYKNGRSEYFLMDEVGNFHYGTKPLVILAPTFLKRKNGLVYPVHSDGIYFNETLTPRIISYKNGLRYQTKELRDLYNLLQIAGAHASILGAYGAGVGSFKASINAFRRLGPATLPGRPLTGRITKRAPSKGGVPEPVSDEADTQRMRAGEPSGEVVGDYRVIGDKGLKGETFERNITGLFDKNGRKTDIRPIMKLAETFIQEARAAGAKELKITGDFIRNENVLRIRRFAEFFGGTARRTGAKPLEIIIPLE